MYCTTYYIYTIYIFIIIIFYYGLEWTGNLSYMHFLTPGLFPQNLASSLNYTVMLCTYYRYNIDTELPPIETSKVIYSETCKNIPKLSEKQCILTILVNII